MQTFTGPESPVRLERRRLPGWARLALRALEGAAWVAFFLVALGLLGLRYWLLPNVERWREDIVAAVRMETGLRVDIGGIRAEWRGLRPRLELSDVRVFDEAGGEALRLPWVGNVLSWRSLVVGELRLHSFAIDGPRLEIRRDREGRLHVAGIRIAAGPDEGRLTDWLLAQNEIMVVNAEIEWTDELRGAPPLTLRQLNFRLANDGHRHALGLGAATPQGLGGGLQLRAELVGRSLTDPAAWSGRVWLELGKTDLAAWRAWVDYPFEVARGEGALRLWLTLADGEPTRITADVSLAGLAARFARELPMLELERVSGRIIARRDAGGLEFGGRNLALRTGDGLEMPASSFRVQWQPGVQGADQAAAPGRAGRGSASAEFIELAPLARLGGFLPFPPALREALGAIAPAGRVQDARIEWTGDLPDPHAYSARLRFQGLSARPWRTLPGFAGLSGSLEATERRGSLQLAAGRSEVAVPKLLPRPRIELDALSGQLAWERAPAGLVVRASGLSLVTPRLAASLNGSWTADGEGPGVVDATVLLPRFDGREFNRYLPAEAVMGKAARKWLSEAVIDGRFTDLRLRVKGNLKDFPFIDRARGVFEASGKVKEGVLYYAHEWPWIKGLEGEIALERNRLEFTGRSGSLTGARLTGLRAVIPDYLSSDMQVTVTGVAEGPSAEFFAFVQQSPVRRMIAGATDGMNAAGRSRMRLRLELPIADMDRAKVQGELEFVGSNTFTFSPALPPIERAFARLAFTESNWTLRELRGALFGGNLAASGGSRPEGGSQIVVRGDATVAGLRPVFDHPWRAHMSGQSGYVATVVNRDGRMQVSAESQLRGIAIHLPPPLGKAVNDAVALRMEWLPFEGGARDRVSLQLGRGIAAEFLRRREPPKAPGREPTMETQRMVVALGAASLETLRVPERPGALIYGELSNLDLDRWLPLLRGDGAPGATLAELRLGTLDAFGKRLTGVTLRAGSDTGSWSARLAATELAGEISFRPGGAGRLVARLRHATVPPDKPGMLPGQAAKELPALDLVAESFTYRGRALGRVEVVAENRGGDWRIERFGMVNPEATLAGKGVWRAAAPPRTNLDFTLEVADAGALLARLGIPDSVKGGKAKLEGGLGWQGDPLAIDYPTLSGEFSLQAENGQFLEIDPGIGKLLSLMNMQMLPRRITLDFRDVFSKGFAFDRITASMHVRQGVMSTRDFRMRGPAAQVEVTGEANLARETQDLRVRVVPTVGSTASTVLGLINPVAGLATLIAQQVLGNPIGQIFAYEYAVTGAWGDPKVERVSAGAAQPQASDPGKGGRP